MAPHQSPVEMTPQSSLEEGSSDHPSEEESSPSSPSKATLVNGELPDGAIPLLPVLRMSGKTVINFSEI